MKKRDLSILTSLVVFLVVAVFVFSFANGVLTGRAIYNPPSVVDCSDSSIRYVWDTIFKESSDNVTILKNVSNPNLYGCVAFKNKSVSTNILQISFVYDFAFNVTTIKAIKANYTSSYLSALNSLSRFENFYLLYPPLADNVSSASFPTYTDAGNEFNSVFKVDSDTWQFKDITMPLYSYAYYYFGFDPLNITQSPSQSSPIITGGQVYRNLSMDYFFVRSYKFNNAGCLQNWTAFNTSCRSDESMVFYYDDTNSCYNETGRPANITVDCDYDHNGIIGNESSIKDNNVNLQLLIDSNALNLSLNYNTSKLIELKEGNLTRISFGYSFSNPLDLSNITVKKQNSSSSFGYLIVNGLNVEKNITIDKLNASSNRVCAKNMEVADIGDISRYCNSTNEFLINCPGSNSSISCSVSNNTYVVSGLTSSAVMEFSNLLQRSCIENWSCSGWVTCVNNSQSRACYDTRGCNTTLHKPAEIQGCVSCISNWQCTNYTPTICPKNQTQTRICTDTNNCEIPTQKPSESKGCVYKKDNTVLIIIIVVGVIVLVALAWLVYYLIKRKEPVYVEMQPGDNTPTYNSTGNQGPPPAGGSAAQQPGGYSGGYAPSNPNSDGSGGSGQTSNIQPNNPSNPNSIPPGSSPSGGSPSGNRPQNLFD